MKSSVNGGRKMERKEKERERRMQMKELCFKLSSLIPNSTKQQLHQEDIMTQQANLDEATTYISELKQRVEKIREMIRDSKSTGRGTKRHTCSKTVAPVIEVRSEDTNLEVKLVSGVHNRFKLHRVIAILEEEGADVKNANISHVQGDKLFYTIHSQAFSSRIGLEASRVLERLQDLVS
ncbi:Transcription factor ORG2 [Carex littledalei]|uniref:Transcription factor ORG2 n=1 Tax=Carex littledalei TaxID=544730 RepID=A0A833VJJ3_9POAL|nr:Transcription factor ORG2 [Carex littledalei]